MDFTRQPDFQKILTNPILDIAARFWEPNRYEAFRVCYRSMRVIDDLVDDRKAGGQEITNAEKDVLKKLIADWLDALSRKQPGDAFQVQLLATFRKFRIPDWPWIKLAEAMIRDIEKNNFETYLAFRRYAEGAAIAPASVFMHLCGVSQSGDYYLPPPFDVRKAARPIALFSYFVHILRDFQKDHQRRLNYFADDLLAAHSLSLDDLYTIANGTTPSKNFRKLAIQYVNFADYYRRMARRSIDGVMRHLDTPYQLSLEVIYGLYLQIFERIDPEHGLFTAEELNPSPAEIQDRLSHIIAPFAR